MNVGGGTQSGTGSDASAAILSSGEMIFDLATALRLTGAGGSGFYQVIPPDKLRQVNGSQYPITVRGGTTFINDGSRGDAFFISGAALLNLDRLLSDFLKSTDCVAVGGSACIIPGTGPRAAVDAAKGQQSGVSK